MKTHGIFRYQASQDQGVENKRGKEEDMDLKIVH